MRVSSRRGQVSAAGMVEIVLDTPRGTTETPKHSRAWDIMDT